METVNKYHITPIIISTALLSLLIIMLAVPAAARSMGEDQRLLVGKIQGYSFVDGSKYHPIDSRDPLVATERMFVFVDSSSGSGFYLLNNVDRGTLTAFIGKEVRLKGAVKRIRDRKLIDVDRIESRQGDQWGIKWTKVDRNHHLDY